MKNKLKLIVFLLSSMILLLLFVSWLLPPEGQVIRSATIHAPKKEVFHHLTYLKTYPHWFPWIQPAPHLNIIYYGRDKKALDGFSFEDHEDKIGFGRFELGETEGDSLIHFIFDYKDMPQLYGSYLLHGEDASNTTVVWRLKMKAGWKPWWRFFASMMNKLTSPMLDSGLARLKGLCEDPQALHFSK